MAFIPVRYCVLKPLRPYLLVLVQMEHLYHTFGLVEVPHGKPAIVYEKCLQGVSWSQQLQDARVAGVRQSKRGALELDGADDAACLEEVDGEASDQDNSDEEFEHFVEEFFRGADLDDDARHGAPEGESAGDAHPVDALGPVQADVEHEGATAAAAAEEERLEAPGRWGAFSISTKHPRGRGHGAFEGACPYHARNSRTKCKRLFTIHGPGPEARLHALGLCKFWLAHAKDVARQWEHLAMPLPDHPPSQEALEGLKIVEAVDKSAVVPDDIFYARQHAAGVCVIVSVSS